MNFYKIPLSNREVSISAIILDLFLLIGAYIILYSACWLVPYLFTDDYSNLAATYRGNLKEYLGFVVVSGRPIYAMSLLTAFSSMHSFASLRILRFISIVGIGFTSWLIYLNLFTSGWKRTSSLLVAYLIGTLPAFQVYASWAITFIFPWATAITAFSVQSLEFKSGTHSKKRLWFITLATFLLIVSINIYQPAAMFYWVFAAINIFVRYKDNYALQIKKLKYYMVVFFSSLISSFVILKIIEMITGQKNSRAEILNNFHDILGKIKWFITQPLIDSANFVNINVSYGIAFFVLIFTIVGLLLYLKGSLKSKFTLIGIGLLLLVFSYTPNLIVRDSLASYRTQVALSSLLFLLFIFAMKGITKFILTEFHQHRFQRIGTIIIGSIFSCGAIYNVIVTFVLPQFTELANIRMQLPHSKLESANTIYYIVPNANTTSESISPIKRYDEFGNPSSLASWAQKNAIFIVLHESDPKYENTPVVVINQNYKIPKGNNTLIVDTSRLWSLKLLF